MNSHSLLFIAGTLSTLLVLQAFLSIYLRSLHKSSLILSGGGSSSGRPGYSRAGHDTLPCVRVYDLHIDRSKCRLTDDGQRMELVIHASQSAMQIQKDASLFRLKTMIVGGIVMTIVGISKRIKNDRLTITVAPSGRSMFPIPVYGSDAGRQGTLAMYHKLLFDHPSISRSPTSSNVAIEAHVICMPASEEVVAEAESRG